MALTASQYGPPLNATYLLGHYLEDFDYLGDLGFTQGADFDLNEQNVRWCVTPEFPAGTYAYFTTINADGTPAFPYTTGRQYFGSPTGGSATISETVTTQFRGGPNKTDTWNISPVAVTGGDVTLLWSADQFHNNGLLPNDADPGRFRVTQDEADRGKFSTPSLRNIALTAPYMHDGRFGTLAEVVAHYSSSLHRSATLDPNLSKHPASGLPLSDADQRALVAFLQTLTEQRIPFR